MQSDGIALSELADIGMQPLTAEQEIERQKDIEKYLKEYNAEIKRAGIFLGREFIALGFRYALIGDNGYLYKESLKELREKKYQATGSHRTWMDVIESLLESHICLCEFQQELYEMRERQQFLESENRTMRLHLNNVAEAQTLIIKMMERASHATQPIIGNGDQSENNAMGYQQGEASHAEI